MNDCSHDRVRHGPGSGYYDIQCVLCGESIGSSISVENAKKNVDWLKSMLEFAQRDIVRSECFEAWREAHPGVVPEGEVK